jgi:peptide/nickel transport system substrate-binding protein
MQRGRLQLLIGAVIAGIALIVAGAAVGARERSASGSVVFGAEQEPPCLNGALDACNNTWTSWTSGIALSGLYIERPDFTFVPYMADGPAKVSKGRPFAITVRIKKKARWSDGKPVSADDLIFTWRLIIDPKNELAGRSGWDSIARAVKINAKTVKFVFKKPYGPWKIMLLQSIYPRHALAGVDFNTVWHTDYKNPKTGVEMASGPYKLSSYTKGQSMTMVRNASFFGKRPGLDRITFRFITVTDSEIQAIRGSEVDVIYPQPQLQLADLRSVSGLKIESNAGAQLEHIDFSTSSKSSNPLLGQRWFRQAIAYSLDRPGMVRQLFRTLSPRLGILNNLSYTSQQKQYVAHFKRYTRNLKKVTSLFQSHGCRKGGDGIWSCDGRKASVRFGTTTGNRLRELCVEILQQQAKTAGIEFRSDSQPSRLLFGRLPTENYDLALFAWVGTGDPAGQTDVYGIGGGSNWKGYQSAAVTRLFKAADAELNPKKRIALVNKADAILANDMVALPLYQKPTYFVYRSKLRHLRDNPSLMGPTWNTEFWSVS